MNKTDDLCPVCNAPLIGAIYTCRECWWKIPAKDRAMLYHMHVNRQDHTSKLESVVKKLKQNQ